MKITIIIPEFLDLEDGLLEKEYYTQNLQYDYVNSYIHEDTTIITTSEFVLNCVLNKWLADNSIELHIFRNEIEYFPEEMGFIHNYEELFADIKTMKNLVEEITVKRLEFLDR